MKTQHPKHKASTVADIAKTVDELGILKGQIADLEKKEAELRQVLVDANVLEAHGSMFKATVAISEYTLVDRKSVIEALPPSAQLTRLLNKHTKIETRTTVKVTSR